MISRLRAPEGQETKKKVKGKSDPVSDKKKKKDKAAKSDKKDKKAKAPVEEKQERHIPYDSDDYIVVKYNGKNHLALAIGKRRAMLEKGVEEDDTSVQIDVEPYNVIANLGPNPPFGKVFNVNVEPYQRTLTIKDWCDLRVYRSSFTKEERITLVGAFADAYTILKKNKCEGFINRMGYIELRSRAGKWAGTYKYVRTKEGEGGKDVMSLNNIPLDDAKYLQYVILHEAAHGIWFHMVPIDVRAKWLSLYAKRITVSKYDEKKLRGLLKEVMTYDGSIGDFLKEMADDTTSVILKEVIAYIKKVHKLDRFDLDLLHDTGRKDRLERLWPSMTDIGIPVMDPSEYAMTNPKEFFAETMSYYLTGTKLTGDLMKACVKTLKNLQRIY